MAIFTSTWYQSIFSLEKLFFLCSTALSTMGLLVIGHQLLNKELIYLKRKNFRKKCFPKGSSTSQRWCASVNKDRNQHKKRRIGIKTRCFYTGECIWYLNYVHWDILTRPSTVVQLCVCTAYTLLQRDGLKQFYGFIKIVQSPDIFT